MDLNLIQSHDKTQNAGWLFNCTGIVYMMFLISMAVLSIMYGIAQLYQVKQNWICQEFDESNDDGVLLNNHCLTYLHDGSMVSQPSPLYSKEYSVYNPTTIGIIYCCLFMVTALIFIIYIIFVFMIKFCPNKSPFYGQYQPMNSTKKDSKRSCCYIYKKYRILRRKYFPNRYKTTYGSCLFVILLQFKRCIIESLYLLQRGGVDALTKYSDGTGITDRAGTKEHVEMFAVLLGSNCILTAILYIFWWSHKFNFISPKLILIIVGIESLYDVLFSSYPLWSHNFQFGYMNFSNNPINFITVYFPLLYLIYSLYGFMAITVPWIYNEYTVDKLFPHFELSGRLYSKWKYTIIIAIIFFAGFGGYIIFGTIIYLEHAQHYCSNTEIVANWTSFYENCNIKLYPFFREHPCDCRVFTANTDHTFLVSTIQFGMREFQNAEYFGIDSGDNSLPMVHFTEDMYTETMQIVIIHGYSIYSPDRWDLYPNLETLSFTNVVYYGNDSSISSSISSLKQVKSILLLQSPLVVSLPDSFCELSNLQYFNCDGCGFSKLPDCFGNLFSLNTLRLNYNGALTEFPSSFYQLNDTLNALYCFNCHRLYSSKGNILPDYFVNFHQLSFAELVLDGTPICDNLQSQSLNIQRFLNASFGCFTICGHGCFPYQIQQCHSQCNVSECHYALGFCLEPECSDYNVQPYQDKMYQIVHNDYCFEEYNTSQCQYGFGSCINSTDTCYNVPPANLTNITAQCGGICETNWLTEDDWCDTSCRTHAINGTCPYPYQDNICSGKCEGYCNLYKYVWTEAFIRGSCDWISGCYLIKFAVPSIEKFGLNISSLLIGLKQNESLYEWWYDITNNSVPLMEPLNIKQTLYWLGPYLNLSGLVDCWNVTHQRAAQISCETCWESWNVNVSMHHVDGQCNQTSWHDWKCDDA